MENKKQYNFPLPEEEETIDIRKLFNYFMENLNWFILTVSIAIAAVFLFNRYDKKIYSTSTTVLIEDENKSTPWNRVSSAGMDLTQGFGMFPSLQNFENQTIIIQSYSQVRRTIDALKFNVSYFKKGTFSKSEIYKSSPFEVIYDPSHPQPFGTLFEVSINNDGLINIRAEAEDAFLLCYGKDDFFDHSGLINLNKTVKPGESIKTQFCDFYISINGNFNREALSANYFFCFNSPHYLTLNYQSKINIEPMTKGSSMIKITLEDTEPQKAIDFLNELINQYRNRSLEKKNEFANNTIRFIDSQLDTISRSLSIAENTLQSFRSRNKVMDLSYQSQQVFEQMQNLENQKMEIEMQKKYYEYILDYIEKNQDIESVLAPSAMGVGDQLLNSLILDINRLSVEKSSLTNIKKDTGFGPLQALDAQIKNAKINITENAVNLVKGADISLNEINKRINLLSISINSLPETERQLFGIKRKFELNDNLYTFLLQRRSESEIAKASNTPDNEIIDRAMLNNNGYPVKPKILINYLIAILIGMAVPSMIIFLKEFFNVKIDSPEKVKKITNIPIVGYIPNSGKGSETNIFADLDSPWAEAFRIIRTKLQFFIKKTSNPIIMVTSSIPGEGKSFVAINLASAYALTGKRTVLVGFDLRRPQVAQRFKVDKNIGVTNFLIGESLIEEIIQKTDNPCLDIIASGVRPPNPAELIADQKTSEFLKLLKTKYDYIILDSAPVSPVSDSFSLIKIVDANLFVVRDRYTHCQIFERSMEEFNSNNAGYTGIVINDIRLNRKRYGNEYGYSYGYHYDYKYGYGYYKEKEKTKHRKVC